MRHALITFFATLLGVVVALVAYQQYQRWDGQRETARTATVVAKVDDQGRELDQKVAAEQRAIELIRADFVAAAAAKVAVTESWLTMGRMPANNAEAGLPPAESYRGRSLKSAAVIADGRIRLTYDGESGRDNGVIDLIPELGASDAMGVQWRCETRDYPQIIRALPTCDYLAPAATATQVP